MRVELNLRVEGNNKYVRGKNKTREEMVLCTRAAIERRVLSRFTMAKPDENDGTYFLAIPYATDEELDKIVYEEILGKRRG